LIAGKAIRLAPDAIAGRELLLYISRDHDSIYSAAAIAAAKALAGYIFPAEVRVGRRRRHRPIVSGAVAVVVVVLKIESRARAIVVIVAAPIGVSRCGSECERKECE
jgi:hypothetical protein